MPSGTQSAHEPEPQRRRRRRWLIAVGACLAFVLAVVAAAGVWWRPASGPPPLARAVIVDQLAKTDPNPTFVADATRQLESAGYAVDYVPADDVTVDFYRRLPAQGYTFVILRSHSSDYVSSRNAVTGATTTKWSIGLFTNEPYSSETHVDEQRQKQLVIERYTDDTSGARFFGITATFIADSTQGRFHAATVVLMGCAGLKTDDLARAFQAKGVKDFVSWDLFVTAQHTDAATESLLNHLLGERQDLREAVANAMADTGPDPVYGATLVAYP